MHIYICIYTHTFTCTYAYRHAYIHIYILTHVQGWKTDDELGLLVRVYLEFLHGVIAICVDIGATKTQFYICIDIAR